MSTDASTSATAANIPSTIALNRCDVSVPLTTSSIVLISSIGCSGSIPRITADAADEIDSGDSPVRMTIAM